MSKKYQLVIVVCGISLVCGLCWYLARRGSVSTKAEDVDKIGDVESEVVESIKLERPPFLNNFE